MLSFRHAMIIEGTPNKGNITIISLCVGYCVLHLKSWKEDYSQQKAYSFNYSTLHNIILIGTQTLQNASDPFCKMDD